MYRTHGDIAPEATELHRERGVVAVEYVILAAGIIAVVSAAVVLIGPQLLAKFAALL